MRRIIGVPRQQRWLRVVRSVVALAAAAAVWLVVGTVRASSSSSSTVVSLQSGLAKVWARRWAKAAELAALEQDVEDYNADLIANALSSSQSSTTSGAGAGAAVRRRRLIVLPLRDDLFNPPMGMFSHNHVQTGDKMSLPACFWSAIQLNQAQVPWLFAVRRIDGVTGPRVSYTTTTDTSTTDDQKDDKDVTKKGSQNENDDEDDDVISEYRPLAANLDTVVGGPLDFRAPANYIFLPHWMMRALGLRPRDVVDVEMIETVAAGALAKLRPHHVRFSRDIQNPQAVLETELRHYSSLTQGSTIAFDYRKKRYWFDVVELRAAPRGEKVPLIKVQDCDIATDFLTSRDVLLEAKKKRQQKQQQKKNRREE